MDIDRDTATDMEIEADMDTGGLDMYTDMDIDMDMSISHCTYMLVFIKPIKHIITVIKCCCDPHYTVFI
jgi:hypothetical protein